MELNLSLFVVLKCIASGFTLHYIGTCYILATFVLSCNGKKLHIHRKDFIIPS